MEFQSLISDTADVECMGNVIEDRSILIIKDTEDGMTRKLKTISREFWE